MERPGYPDVNLPPDGVGSVDGPGIIAVQLAKYAESVFRHHLLNSAPVVIPERKIGVVPGISPVPVICFFVRVGKVGVGECIYRAVGAARFLPCRLDAEIQTHAIVRAHCHVCAEIVAVVAVVDEHSVLVVDASGHIVGVSVRAAAQRDVVVLGKCVAEQKVIPVGGLLLEAFEVGILGGPVPGHPGEIAEPRPDLAHDSDHGIKCSGVRQRSPVAAFREFVPQFLFPLNLFCGIHQVHAPLRPERPGETVVVAHFHPSLLAAFGGDHDDTVGRA